MCCGKSRAAFAGMAAPPPPPVKQDRSNAGVRARSGQALSPAPSATGSVSVRYVEQPAITVRGPATGRLYTFSGTNPFQSVDARDASALLNTRFFRRG
jgi:hypothetical protein